MKIFFYVINNIKYFSLINVIFTFSSFVLSQNISVDSLKKHVYYLASEELEGRFTGEKGQKLAANYIQNKFIEYGLLPLTNDGYFQEFNLIKEEKSGKFQFNNVSYYYGNDFALNRYFTPFVMNSEKVYYLKKDVKYKSKFDDAVLILDSDFQNYNQLLNKVKPQALIINNPYLNMDFYNSFNGRITNNFKEDEYPILTIDLSKNLKPRSFRKVQHLNDVYFELNPNFKFIETENVIGFIPGSDSILKNEFVVVSAHYDHIGIKDGKIHFGADDNASGVSSMLEVARNISMSPKDLKPKKSIIFVAFSAEELGLYGSEYFVNNPLISLNKINYNLNIDMIGRSPTFEDSNLVYIIGSKVIESTLHDYHLSANESIKMDVSYEFKPIGPNLYRRSDQYNFIKNGIPSIFYFTGLHADYHQATDTPDKIDYLKMKRISELIYKTIINCSVEK